MSHMCCKEFRGWCKSFTSTEVLLAVLEGLLLVAFLACLLFLILHLVSCPKSNKYEYDVTESGSTDVEFHVTTVSIDRNSTKHSKVENVTSAIACTWKMSQKTPAATRYYETHYGTVKQTVTFDGPSTVSGSPLVIVTSGEDVGTTAKDSEGVEADDIQKSFVLALVKLSPPQDLTFGCILTIVSEHWTVTAASCVESIEEIDSLDSFVILENYGEMKSGESHSVSDVQVHPQYQGVNRSYDIVGIKCSDRLLGAKRAPRLPSLVDYYLVTLGESLTLLGFGNFRNMDHVGESRGLRAALVHVVSTPQCGGSGAEGEGWSPRHLGRGGPVGRGACSGGPRALCAGVLRARMRPCTYCAGAPLLSGRTLLALMADAPHCGVSCEPALYVNIAALRDWIDSIIVPD